MSSKTTRGQDSESKKASSEKGCGCLKKLAPSPALNETNAHRTPVPISAQTGVQLNPSQRDGVEEETASRDQGRLSSPLLGSSRSCRGRLLVYEKSWLAWTPLSLSYRDGQRFSGGLPDCPVDGLDGGSLRIQLQGRSRDDSRRLQRTRSEFSPLLCCCLPVC